MFTSFTNTWTDADQTAGQLADDGFTAPFLIHHKQHEVKQGTRACSRVQDLVLVDLEQHRVQYEAGRLGHV